jgi:hypothetical protein
MPVRVANIRDMTGHPVRDVGNVVERTAAEVVDNNHFVATSNQLPGQFTSDGTATASYDVTH